MLVLMMGVMDMFVLMIHCHMNVRVDVLLRKVYQSPIAIKAPAAKSLELMGSSRNAIERTAPKNGATEKYAPVRAVARWRSPMTKSAKLAP